MKLSSNFFGAAALVVAGALSGCVVVPVGRPHGAYVGEAVIVAPPAPRVEVVGLAPGPGFFWIGGNWTWAGGRHTWVGGHWEAQRPGYRWAPHQWHQEGPGWRAEPGRWERG